MPARTTTPERPAPAARVRLATGWDADVLPVRLSVAEVNAVLAVCGATGGVAAFVVLDVLLGTDGQVRAGASPASAQQLEQLVERPDRRGAEPRRQVVGRFAAPGLAEGSEAVACIARPSAMATSRASPPSQRPVTTSSTSSRAASAAAALW